MQSNVVSRPAPVKKPNKEKKKKISKKSCPRSPLPSSTKPNKTHQSPKHDSLTESIGSLTVSYRASLAESKPELTSCQVCQAGAQNRTPSSQEMHSGASIESVAGRLNLECLVGWLVRGYGIYWSKRCEGLLIMCPSRYTRIVLFYIVLIT